jgi:hypothetical protein
MTNVQYFVHCAWTIDGDISNHTPSTTHLAIQRVMTSLLAARGSERARHCQSGRL